MEREGREGKKRKMEKERLLPIRWRCERRMSRGCVVIVWSALFTDYHTFIAFKLPHSTHRRGQSVYRSIDWSIGRSVRQSCYTLAARVPFPRRSTPTTVAAASLSPISLPLFYTRTK